MKNHLPLFLILIFALTVRFLNIDIGIFNQDSGVYANDAKGITYGIRWIMGNIFSLISGKLGPSHLLGYLQERGASFPSFAKPGYELLLGLGFLLVGVSDKVFVGVNIVLGIGLIILVYYWSRLFLGERIALFAALTLATLKYQLVFSLNGLADMCSSFFIFLSFYLYSLYYRKKEKYLYYLSSLILGFAFTTNYKIFIVPFIFFLLEIIFFVKKIKPFNIDTLKQLALYILLFFLPLLVMEIPYRLANIFLKEALPSWVDYKTYFEQLVFYFIKGKEVYFFTLSHLFSYPLIFWKMEGPFFCFFLLSGLFSLIKKTNNYQEFGVFIFFIIPLLLWSFLTGHDPSTKPLAIIMPFGAIIAGKGVDNFLNMIPSLKIQGIFSLCLILVFLIYSVINSQKIFRAKSPFPHLIARLLDYMEKKGGEFSSYQGTYTAIVRFYLTSPQNIKRIKQLKVKLFNPQQRSDYLILVGRPYGHPESEEFLKRTENLKPVIVVNNNIRAEEGDLFLKTTNPFPIMQGRNSVYLNDSMKDKVLIYDLR